MDRKPDKETLNILKKHIKYVKNHVLKHLACLVLEHAPKCLFFLSIKIDRVRKEHFGHLKNSLNPKKIILFGSRARGDHFKESDFDLIVVSDSFEKMDFRERIIKAYGMWDFSQGPDIIGYTPEEFEKKRKQIGIVQEAVKEGIEI